MNSMRKMILVLMGIFLIINGWFLFAQDMDEIRGIAEIIGELEKTQHTGSIRGMNQVSKTLNTQHTIGEQPWKLYRILKSGIRRTNPAKS